MQFLHFVIFPLFFFVFCMILQQWTNDEDFTNMFKLYGMGIIGGFIIKIFFSIFNPIFNNKANHLIIFIKSLSIDGIIFSILVIISFYILFDLFTGISSTINWLWSTFFFLSYILGIFTTINGIEAFYSIYPQSPLFYIPFFSFILLISFISGLGVFLFIESYNMILKVIIALFTILIVASLSMVFNYLRFYNYYEYFYFIIPTLIFAIIFEFTDFRYMRN